MAVFVVVAFAVFFSGCGVGEMEQRSDIVLFSSCSTNKMDISRTARLFEHGKHVIAWLLVNAVAYLSMLFTILNALDFGVKSYMYKGSIFVKLRSSGQSGRCL